MGFEKTYRKRQLWGSHGKRTGLNQRILIEQERERRKFKHELEQVDMPFNEKRRMVSLKKKRQRRAKWGRNAHE